MDDVASDNTGSRHQLWEIHRAASPVLATAIHDGQHLDPLVASNVALEDTARLREEDPFTGLMIAGVPNRIICNVSRFCIDLNRPIDKAIYLQPSDAWDLVVWKRELRDAEIDHLRAMHQDYYDVLEAVLKGLERRHGHFIVLDVHSYNHRRAGPYDAPTAADLAPDINIGTHSMDRHRWAHVVDEFTAFCRAQTVNGHRLDVRENIAFEGRGEQTRFIHEHFPETGCAIAVELKKIFMDEWTGAPDQTCIDEIAALLAGAVPVLERALETGP